MLEQKNVFFLNFLKHMHDRSEETLEVFRHTSILDTSSDMHGW